MPSSATHPHQHFLAARLPAWAATLHAAHWQALGACLTPPQGEPGAEADWFANAAPALREALLSSQSRLDAARHRLAEALTGLEQISAFAEPRLGERLREEHQFAAPLRSTELIWLHHLFTHDVYVTTHERRSLLEAALHNFAADVSFSADSALALEGHATCRPITVIGKTTLGDSETLVDIPLHSEQFEITALPLSPADFADTCRRLDLGGQYQAHLDSHFAAPAVRPAAIALYQHSLRASAELAHVRHQISGAARDAVQRLIDGQHGINCQQLELFGVRLHEALLIDAGDAGLLLYLPGHETMLRQFDGLEAVRTHLQQALLAPASRQAFSAYVNKAQWGALLDRAQQNLDSGHSGMDQAWSLAADADLHLRVLGIDTSLFDFLFDDHVARLKAEARLLAVPTAEADEQARKHHLALWQSLGLNALMAAGFFVPAVGGLMLLVTAYQLLDEVYTGYQAWSVGDRREALQHLETTGLNLALIAGLGAAGAVAGKLASTPLMERLMPVELADGTQRLWLPELTGYRSQVELPQGLTANARGQFVDQGRHFIRLDGQLYEQRLDPVLQRWRLVHPDDAHAYAPLLEHNGDGAWRVEHEQPQAWDVHKLVQRLGPALADISEAEALMALDITGLNSTALREIHLNNLPTPPLLADTLERLKIARDVAADLPGQTAQAWVDAIAERYGAVTIDTDCARLLDRYPDVPTPLARRLVNTLPAEERALWRRTDTLPPSLRQALDRLRCELPLARGLEGLHLPILAGESSERLLFASLTRLPDWPQDLRLELRAASPQGALLRECGVPLAPRRLRLIKSAAGYEADLGERPAPGRVSHDLLQALLWTLPQELGTTLAQGGADALRVRLRTLIGAARGTFRQRLLAPEHPGWRSRLRLLGGLDPTPQRPDDFSHHSLASRLRRLYPLASLEDAQRTLRDWQAALRVPEIEVARLEARLRDLQAQLSSWAGTSARRQRAMQRIVDAQRGSSIVRLIDGTAQHVLDLSGIGLDNASLESLVLPDDFRHITELDLTHSAALSRLPEHWLQRFPALQRLKLRGCGFSRVPRLTRPEALVWLEMDRNPITWDPAQQADFDRYLNLRVVDFSDCPLTRAPDLSRHVQIRTLYMDNCLLSTLPTGLQHVLDPLLLDFSRNPLQTLPPAFALPDRIARTLRLESETLSAVAAEQIDAFYSATGIDLLVPDSDYEELLAEADDAQQGIWSRLPLAWRRDLRELLESDRYLDGLPHTRTETWRRLERQDQDRYYRRRVLAQPAINLLDRPIEQS
ncbi:DUF6543 domain-containing protein [Pseudomonas sp. REB1044]|uniref:dermonecrotic toxin domain-containing protein n=1 Tax=Pseudomonas sp. REB1044 TaxID=2675224 RepID=UPI00315CD10F